MLHTEVLEQNIDAFRCALDKYWPNYRLAYSVKTNSLPWIIRYMNQHGLMSEVVSDFEYRIAKACGSRGIIVNGPLHSVGTMEDSLRTGMLINIDSDSAVQYITGVRTRKINCIGLRVNVEASRFDPEDIECAEDGFRFGFSIENGAFEDVLNRIRQTHPETKIGLHMHCCTMTRSVKAYRVIAGYAAELVRTYQIAPAYIDIGGGFFGGVPGKPSAEDYLRVIRRELETTVSLRDTMLILEPGAAIVSSAADYVTTVLDVKHTNRAVIVTTDGSRTHLDPLWRKTRYEYTVANAASDPAKRQTVPRQIVCGCTCMESDRIMILENEPELKRGDRIIYHKSGGYTMTFGGLFITPMPAVYTEMNGSMTMIRAATSPERFLEVQSLDH